MRVTLAALLLAGCAVEASPPPPPPPPLVTPHRPIEIDAAVTISPVSYPGGTACGIVNSGSWRGLIRDRGDENKDLVILGAVGVKPSATVSISFDPLVRESDPVQRQAQLRAVHPPEPTIDMLEQRRVEAQLTYRPPLGRLSLRCGTREIAEFSDPREHR